MFTEFGFETCFVLESWDPAPKVLGSDKNSKIATTNISNPDVAPFSLIICQ